MPKNLLSHLLVLSLALTFLAFPLTILAQLENISLNNSTGTGGYGMPGLNMDPEIEKLKERTNEQAVDNCSEIVDNLTTRLQKMSLSRDSYLTRYQKLEEKLGSLIENLKAENKETGRLEEQQKVLKEQVAKFSTSSQAILDGIKVSRESACSKTAQDFKSEIDKARQSLKETSDTSQETVKLVKTNILEEVSKFK